MFLPLNRVQVLESSATKKLSPRKNSEGFIQNHLTTVNITVPRDIGKLLNVTNFKLFFYDVRWYKFGNEERTRDEPKVFVVVLPLYISPYGDGAVAENFINLLPSLVKNKDVINSIRRAAQSRPFGFLKSMRGYGTIPKPLHSTYLNAARLSPGISLSLYGAGIPVTKEIYNLRHALSANKLSWQTTLELDNKRVQDGIDPSLFNGLQKHLATSYRQMLHEVPTKKIFSGVHSALDWAAKGVMFNREIIEERRKLVLSSSKMTTKTSVIVRKMLTFISDLHTQV